MAYGKIPPQAKDLEKAVLGAIMLEKSAFDRVNDILTVDSFYVEVHQHIYQAFVNLVANSLPIDILTVVEALRSAEKLDIVGGPYAVTVLTNEVVSAANIEAHAAIIQQKYQQRELIRMSSEIIHAAYEDSTDVDELFNSTEAQLFKISSHTRVNGYQSAATLAWLSLAETEALQARKIDLTGVPTGWNVLDRLTNGWQPTDFILLAARPSVGKTAFALNITVNAARSPIKKTGVGIFSLEMSAKQLVNRMLSYIGQVELSHIIRGRLTEEEKPQYYAAVNSFSQMNIQIDDTGGIDIHQLRSKARQMVSKDGVGLIVIDYLQLMSGLKDKNGNREQEISTISRSLKALAKELGVPIIALSQMSRAIETQKREPVLSDLRESGSLEQDADMVMFLTRPDYGMAENEKDQALANKGYTKIAKHRNGTLETLAFETDFSTQSWNEFNTWTAVNKLTEPSSYKITRSPLPQEFDEPF